MRLKVNENNVIVGLSDTEEGIEVPDLVAGEIEALLKRQDVDVMWVNGDVRVVNRPQFWDRKLREQIRALTQPKELEINFGDVMHIDVAYHLPIITAYAACDAHANRALIDARGCNHLLTNFEWKNVLNIACDLLSQLANIQNASAVLTADSEDSYNARCQVIKHKVAAAYGRP